MNYHDVSLHRRLEIENELLALMQEVSFDRIAVKDITQRLNISRKTFYRYFPNKHACLDSLTDRYIYECHLHLLQSTESSPQLSQYYEGWLTFWMAHRAFLNTIISNKLESFLLERFMEYFRKEEPSFQTLLDAPQMVCDEDILFFYLSGELFLLLKWCAAGFPLPMETMVQKLLRLVCQPLVTRNDA